MLRIGFVMACLALASFGSTRAATGTASGDANGIAAFQAAWQRVTNGQPDLPDPPALKQLAIYPYLVAARLSRDLTGPDAAEADSAIATFLARHAGQPVTRRLTTSWLRSLAARKDWPAFLLHYDAARADDALRCDRLEALIATHQTTGLVAKVTDAYLVGRDQPACAPAFAWLKAQGQLPDSLIARRAQLALEAGNGGFASALAAQLPPAQAAPIDRWADLLGDPAHALQQAVAQPEVAIPTAALEAGFSRLVRSDVDLAASLYPQLVAARKLDPDQARAFTRLLALGLAWDRRPEALQYFAKLGDTVDDPLTAQWRVRAALWAGDWQRVHDWIAAMPAALRGTDQWRYWEARSDTELGDQPGADAIYRGLASGNGYYAALAAWRMKQGFVPSASPLVDAPQLRAALAAQPGVIRAHELYEVDLSSLASVEWQVALAGVPSDERLQGIRLAYDWGWYAQAVATASGQGIFSAYELLYPLPYMNAVAAAAASSGLPKDWIYAVTRQESLYDPRAVSRSGALGLMQLLPSTAQATARRIGVALPDPSSGLFDPALNLELGAAHLGELVDLDDQRLIVALAGYNAGRRAAQRWLPATPRPADVWIENIPYNETRRYVRAILWHIVVFGWRETGQPQSLAALLQPVSAAEAG
ncbi:MAG TPA: transglycosylase SLT domain-containing protein [Nevskiaceae bacterium]